MRFRYCPTILTFFLIDESQGIGIYFLTDYVSCRADTRGVSKTLLNIYDGVVLSAIWLPYGQVWAGIELTAPFT